MEFKEAMRIWKRMCKTNACESRPMWGKADACPDLLWNAATDVEVILAKWAEEHPERTRINDFLDKHPHAPMCDDGTPKVCAYHCGYCAECSASRGAVGCFECWREPLEEAEG